MSDSAPTRNVLPSRAPLRNRDRPPRLLFVGEAVTFAHIVRPLTLARSILNCGYEVHFASDTHFPWLTDGLPLPFHRLRSRTPHEFQRILHSGGVLFDEEILSNYCDAETDLINTVQPDLIIGDLRPSLSVSGTIHEIPVMTITNAYWSPYAAHKNFPYPCLESVRRLGLNGILGKILLKGLSIRHRMTLHTALEAQNAGLNRMRTRHALPPFQTYLEGFTAGDYVLYSDVPTVVPTDNLPFTHRYVGPVTWNADVELPPWFSSLPATSPLIYVTLGSSGCAADLPVVLDALRTFPGYVALTTEQPHIPIPAEIKERTFVERYLPGDRVAARASLVITNGGSPSGYQALEQGTPIVGIPGNMDQLIFMSYIERSGTGIAIRSDTLSAKEVRYAWERILAHSSYRAAARAISAEITRYLTQRVFAQTVDEILGGEKGYGRMYAM